MNKNKASAGKGSAIYQYQADTIYLQPHNEVRQKPHCGRCQNIIMSCQKKQEKIFFKKDDLTHCNNLEEIDNVISYLSYYYCDILSRNDEGYIKPALTINEGHSEIGATTCEEYENIDFFIEDGYHQYFIIGEGGIGKSIFLSKLFYSLIIKSIKGNCTIVPFIADCDYFGRDATSPQEWLKNTINKKFPQLNVNSLILDQNNKVIFIIDALNSFQYKDKEDYNKKMALWSQFVKEHCDLYHNVSFVIASREISELIYFECNNQKKIYLSPLGSQKIEDFINLFIKDQDTQSELNFLVKSYFDMHFIGIPFFLKKLIETRAKKTEISNKTELVLLYLTTLFDKKDKKIDIYGVTKLEDLNIGGIIFKDIKVNEVSFFDIMCRSAFMCQKQNKKVLNEDDIKSISNSFEKESIERILSIALDERIMNKNRSVFVFSHPILQEIFAALYIHTNLVDDYICSDIAPFDNNAMNIEVLPHIYNMSNNKEKFINLLIDNGKLIYAAECVVNNGEILKNKVANAIISYLKNIKGNLNIIEIYDLSLYLGLIGDIRFNLNNEYIEPNLSRVTMLDKVSISIYPVTNLEYKKFIDDGGYLNKKYWTEAINANWFNYDTILQSMFEFWSEIRLRFINNDGAFADFCRGQAVDIEQCAYLAWFLNMTDDDLKAMLKELYKKEKYSQPLLWNDPKYNNPSQPVVGISYYEAQAYCNWLSNKTGKKYRLLSSDEWEKASRSKTHKYVFGEDINSNNCNTIETKVNAILPVGVLYNNRTPEGIFDLNGNIFEWSNTVYKDNYNPLQRQYVVKGGSWIQGKERSTSSYIGRAKAWCRNIDVGFRVCLDEND